ncbi:Histone-lysine N-methyltransferase trr [Phytophthora cinnamomi]|uniref:Histone-lysine N-methyltransferase trr n=1 Tax=Phytophthora cinnamomi TaxID=4785 RepID=UPI00355A34DD|nr:Histone-lysine N-methyltransferase trr [Phytophthora cinnamomi]
MVHLVHSAVHWSSRCIVDTSSGDENVSPNWQRGGVQAPAKSAKSSSPANSTGTTTPPWMSPQHGLRVPRETSNPPPTEPSKAGAAAPTLTTTDPLPPETPPTTWNPRSPTTSSPVLLEDPPTSRPRSPSPVLPEAAAARRSRTPSPPSRRPLRERQSSRRERRAVVAPYQRRSGQHQEATLPTVSLQAVMRATRGSRVRVRLRAAQPHALHRQQQGRFVPARWPFAVAHLREQFNPTGIIFPAVPHFGWCDCVDPCRVGRCRNSLMQLYCNINCCPYGGNCGNGLAESSKVALARNAATRELAVVAQEFIDAGEVLGEYLGEIEHVSVSHATRPRNEGYRLIMTQRPERPNHPVRVAINARQMGGLMRFVNHSCAPVAQFLEVANGRRTTVVIATTHAVYEGDEITVDYGPDLWFVCRCGYPNCRHRDIQDQQDP